MAEAMIGFGIGLSGTPKDYTGIIAARERQKAADEARARAAKAKEYEDVMKALNIEEHLGYKKEELGIQLGSTIEKVKKAIDSDDYRSRIIALNEFQDQVRRSKAEWKDVQDYKKQIAQGDINPDINIEALEKANTLDEVRKYAPYDENTKTLQLSRVPKVDFGKIYTEVIRNAEKKPTGNYFDYQTADGRTIRQAELEANPDEIIYNLDMQWKQNPFVASNAIIDYKRSIGASGKTAAEIGKTDAQLADEAYKLYIKSGLEYGPSQKLITLPQKPGETKVSVSMGAGEGIYGTGELTPKTIMSGFTQPDKSVENREVDVYSTTIKPFPALGWITSSLRNQSTNELIEKSDIIDFNWGEIGVAPVWKGDFTYDGKTTKGVKGKLVSRDMLALAEQQGLVEYKVIIAGTGKIKKRDDSNKIKKVDGKEAEETIDAWRDAKDVIGASSLPKDKTKVLEEQYSKAQILANELNAKLPKSKTRTTAAPAKTTAAPIKSSTKTETKATKVTPERNDPIDIKKKRWKKDLETQ